MYESYLEDDKIAFLVTGFACNCCAIFLILLASFSPVFLWGSTQVASFSDGNLYSLLGTGIEVAALTSKPIPLEGNVTIPAQVTRWSEITSELACDVESELFLVWSGKYGYCSSEGTFTTPREYQIVQVSLVASVMLLLVMFVFAGCSHIRRHKLLRFLAVTVALITLALTIVNFTSISLSPWLHELRSKNTGVLPFFNSQQELIPYSVELNYGASFAALVMAFITQACATASYIYIWFSTITEARVRQETIPKGHFQTPEVRSKPVALV